MKRFFVIDWSLVFSFVLSAYSGIELHIAGHDTSHEVWHNWAVFHVLTSLTFLVFAVLHVQGHWAWYKGWLKRGLGSKSRITALLSIIFLLVTLTGIILLSVEGGNSSIGLWHYRIGLLVTFASIGHIAKRWSVLKKSLN